MSRDFVIAVKVVRVPEEQCWAAILKNVSFKAIQIHNF